MVNRRTIDSDEPQDDTIPIEGSADTQVPAWTGDRSAIIGERRWAEYNKKFNDLIYRVDP